MDKLNELKRVNAVISRQLKSLDTSLHGDNRYKSELIYNSYNEETSIEIYSIKGNQKSETFIENEFQRIICTKGEVKINLYNGFNEEIILSSSNTILIPPKTKFSVECLKDAELIVVFKPRKDIEEKVLINNSIYSKIS